LEKSISTQTWHISGTIKIKEKYDKVSKTGREYIYIIEKKKMVSFIKVLKMKLLMYLEKV
jgi:hypothetical protein